MAEMTMRLSGLVLSFSLLAALALSACHRTSSSTHPDLIVMDDWWSIDFVRNGCQFSRNPDCQTSTAQEIVSKTDSDFEVAFATEGTCSGLSLMHFYGPGKTDTHTTDVMTAPHWFLILDIHSDSSITGWTLGYPKGKDGKLGGQVRGDATTVDKLAETVCKIARGTGGRIE
jgi:hypothetical protein